MDSPWIWIGFNAFVLGMLALDLGVFHRKAHVVSVKEASIWSVVWISLALLFNLGLYFWQGQEIALQFFTGYVIEKSLSIDNIFVFVLIFSAFRVNALHQHRVLFWGVLGALAMRGLLIFVGAALLKEFHGILYVFGAFLLFTGIKMALPSKKEKDLTQNPVVTLARRFFPVTNDYVNDRFVTKIDGRWMVTPLLLVLLVVETTDLIFAVDSIPAIFAVSQNPFIVYTSNVFAILGLRSLYFVLAGVIDKFVYLKPALATVLSFVGIKMLLLDIVKIPVVVSLTVILGILSVAIIASVIKVRTAANTEIPL
jgi:tellurite resistance protein TerC